MTQDEVISMARECGHWTGQTVEMNDVGLERFAALVAAAEREACARECDDLARLNRTSDTDSMWQWEECAAAIRQRGER